MRRAPRQTALGNVPRLTVALGAFGNPANAVTLGLPAATVGHLLLDVRQCGALHSVHSAPSFPDSVARAPSGRRSPSARFRAARKT